VGIYHGGIELGMAEDLRNALDRHVILIKAGSEGMAEGVTVDVGTAEIKGRVFLYRVMPGGTITAYEKGIGAELVSVLLKIILDLLLQTGVDRHDPFLVALPMNQQKASCQVKAVDAKTAHLRHPEASVRHKKYSQSVLVFFNAFC